ncbi:universal stress protein [Nocardioides albidus]|uniref:Universal stress protein n=1 Tax=Nocardioides albidus TaxID=1517589 RepID=A0A5C4W1W1_9ACTN|nr:universal stress protein [Nocardioides albidus]TNM42023.1 universal stress protein [Nocardioides albidus]
MSILVGLLPDERFHAPLRLGISMALAGNLPLRLCTIVSGSAHGLNAVDSAYLEALEASATAGLAEMAALVTKEVKVSTEVRRARSVPAGLLEAAGDARYLVVGSSPSGVLGRVALGGIGDRLLHTSTIPVGLAPRDYDVDSRTRINRLTVAFGGTASAQLIAASAAQAAELGAELRIASFNVHPVAMFGSMIESGPQALIAEKWAEAKRAEIDATLLTARSIAAVDADVVVGHGTSWAEALADVPWRAGDVLVVGSGAGGLAGRVFVGSQASRIIRHAPVPVVCVPRHAVTAAAV